MTPSILSRIPIKIGAPLVLTTPVLIVAAVLSFLAFTHGRTAVNDLIAQNLVQIQDQIDERLEELLEVPGRINRINAHLILQGKLDPANIRGWWPTFFEQLQAFKMLSAVTWGGTDGQAVWVARYPGQGDYELGVKDDKTGNAVNLYGLDSSGKLRGERLGAYLYEPRLRPWYRAAIKAGKPTWSEIYAWAGKDGSRSTLAVALVQPLRNAAGKIIGVIDSELSLHDISAFLESLRVGKTGRAFVMDRQGRLVATSTSTPVTNKENVQLAASESLNRYVAAAGKHLEKEFDSLWSITVPHQLRLIIEEDPSLLMVSPFEHGEGLSWLVATLIPEKDFMAEIESARRQHIEIGIAAVAITVVLGLVLAFIAVRAMLALVGHVRKIGEGDLGQELRLRYSPEFVQLSNEINAMTSGLRDRMRLRHSLALAMEVQQNLLPSHAPDIEGLDIAGHSTYCDETGGDYYDFLDISGLSSTTAAIAIGDVAGHGVAAAMLMATARGILRSRCQDPGTLADLLTHMNNLLVADTGGERFMTMLLMTIDAKIGHLRWATAGHEPPFVYDSVSDEFIELKGSGLPLGIMEDETYDEHDFDSVRKGQVYMASTDGIWETLNEKGEMFGRKRLRDLLRSYAHLSAAKISEGISKDLQSFRGNSKQSDDIAFVVIKVISGDTPK
jgi:sigma-B regulation protein RsbU (phosphoserine phosphatase)